MTFHSPILSVGIKPGYKINQPQLQEIISKYKRGYNPISIAGDTGFSLSTIMLIIRKNKVKRS